MSNTLIIVSSLGENVELGNLISHTLTELEGKHKILNLCDLDLPLYTSREEQGGIPNGAKELAQEFIKASSFVVIAPEYNGSMPPVLNNAISWVSRGGGDDWRLAFNQKYAVVATHSGGGGASVLQAMRQQWEYLGCTVLARGIQTNYQKKLNPESAKTILSQLIHL